MPRYGTFAGGIDLPDEKRQTLDEPIRPWGPLTAIRLPLGSPRRSPAVAVVQPGQQVEAGQLLARADGPEGMDVFSPFAATVGAVTTADLADWDEFSTVAAVTLEPLSGTVFDPGRHGEPVFDWRSATATELLLRLAEGGLLTCRRVPRRLVRWLDRARASRCTTLIVNVMESQPYVTSDHRLLVDYAGDVLRGLAMLGRAIGCYNLVLAVDERRRHDYQGIVEACRLYKINRFALFHKYPIGADAILVKVLTRREVPLGGQATDVGVAVVDAATCFSAFRWVAYGQRQLGRVVTVSGERVSHPGNYWVPLGTPVSALAGQAEPPLIHGGPMNGLRCSAEAVVSPGTDAVLALTADVPRPPSPCIRCAWCTDHCPARLNVAALNDMFELRQLEDARRLGVVGCVECGLCSFVCPARLPLSQRVRTLKRLILDERRVVEVQA